MRSKSRSRFENDNDVDVDIDIDVDGSRAQRIGLEDSGSLISETEERKTLPDPWYARYARGTAEVRGEWHER